MSKRKSAGPKTRCMPKVLPRTVEDGFAEAWLKADVALETIVDNPCLTVHELLSRICNQVKLRDQALEREIKGLRDALRANQYMDKVRAALARDDTSEAMRLVGDGMKLVRDAVAEREEKQPQWMDWLDKNLSKAMKRCPDVSAGQRCEKLRGHKGLHQEGNEVWERRVTRKI